MSELLTYDQIRIWTDLCYEICIRRMRIFPCFITSLIAWHTIQKTSASFLVDQILVLNGILEHFYLEHQW